MPLIFYEYYESFDNMSTGINFTTSTTSTTTSTITSTTSTTDDIEPPGPPDETDHTLLIILCSVGIGLLAILAAVCFIFRKHICKKKKPREQYIIRTPYTRGTEEIDGEFNSLMDCVNRSATTEIAKRSENRNKNRYPDSTSYDFNIVDLGPGRYVNASYIEPDFIVSQDPLQMEDEDEKFWFMIWQTNVSVIVRIPAVTSNLPVLVYTPPKKWVLGDLEVISNGEPVTRVNYIERQFQVQKKGDSNVRNVTHYHLTCWQGEEVPDKVQLLRVMLDIKKRKTFLDQHGTSRTLVHCGSGAGRTGAFIAIWQIMDDIDRETDPNVYEVACSMRRQRAHMINRLNLYKLIYDCADYYYEFMKKTGAASRLSDGSYEHVGQQPQAQNVLPY